MPPLPDSQPTSNQDKLAGLQSGISSMAAPSSTRAPLPWERDDAPVTVSSDASATIEPSLDETAMAIAAEPLSSTDGEVQQPGTPAGVYVGQHLKDLRYWTGTDWDARPLAPIWTRVWCYAIDQTLALLLGLAAAVAIFLPLSFLSSSGAESSGMESVLATLPILAWIPVFLLYFAASYALWGRTPGMMLGRLYVIDLPTGTRLRWGRAWLRSIVLNVQMLTGILTLIWIVLTATSQTRQGPHDTAARSVVLRGL